MQVLMRIAHGNGHNKQTLVNFIRRAGADSASANEAHRLLTDLGAIPNTRLISVPRQTKDPRGRTTAIVTSDDNEYLGEQTLLLAEAMPKVSEKLHPDRFGVTSYFAHHLAERTGFRGVAHRAIHPPPTVMKHNSHHPVVEAYRDYLASTAALAQADRKNGFLNVITGDLQAGARYKAAWSPREMLANPLNLKCRVVAIDWIMVDPALKFVGPLETHELFDHTGFIATLGLA